MALFSEALEVPGGGGSQAEVSSWGAGFKEDSPAPLPAWSCGHWDVNKPPYAPQAVEALTVVPYPLGRLYPSECELR